MENTNKKQNLTELECPVIRFNRNYQPSRLTEKERWECTIRFLNRCYQTAVNDQPFEMPCESCPFAWTKCLINKDDTWLPALEHFKVIEQFTGEGTVVGTYMGSGL